MISSTEINTTCPLSIKKLIGWVISQVLKNFSTSRKDFDGSVMENLSKSIELSILFESDNILFRFKWSSYWKKNEFG